jgi:chromosomal replication initiator protein
MTSASLQDDIWAKTIAILQNSLRRTTLAKWIPDLQNLGFDGHTLSIGAPSSTAQHFLEDKASPLLMSGLTGTFEMPISVRFVPNQLALHLDEKPKSSPLPLVSSVRPSAVKQVDEAFACSPLNQRYTFEQFVVGKNNQIAHAAARAISKAPGRSYNPLFIYGGNGLGKTHLMQAIGHAALRLNPALKVNYVSGDTFTYHVVSSIREDRFSAFREAYRNVDIWLVDDIQFIASRERTESEFFQAFNTLYETGKQIIITSDRPPKDLQIVDPRLRSRFEWGLMTDIKMPDLETRIAILQKKVEQEGARVPADVIRYIATTISANIRVLEGALIKVLATSSLTGEEITLAMASEQLRDHTTATGEKPISINEIQQLVFTHFGISLEELTGSRRTQNLVMPRQIAMYLCRTLLNSSFPEIARQFGGRDHSTVMYACTKLEQTMKIDRQMRAIVGELTSKLQEAMH